jgi:hypothetical protein
MKFIASAALAAVIAALSTSAPAEARTNKETAWHGWVVRSPAVFYWEGRRYEGGSPRGSAAWYNNGEGGFNAAAFWKIYDRHAPG